MTKEQRKQLRQNCKQLLENSGKSATSREGQSIVYSFWVGVACTEDMLAGSTDAYIHLNLMSGRVDRLMEDKDEAV